MLFSGTFSMSKIILGLLIKKANTENKKKRTGIEHH